MSFINIIALFLTVAALALAIWQTLLAHRQTKDLSFISNALSTRYLGTFPEYFPQLNDLIKSAKHELLILSTIPAHGAFSDHEGWLKEKHALEIALNHKVRIACIFADALKRQENRNNQFRDAIANWSAWRSDPTNATRLQHIVEKFDDSGSIQELTVERFFNLLEKASIEELKTTYRGAEVTEINSRPPLHMWVADGDKAIFVISTTRRSHIAQAFWTTDARLINALVDMHQEYRAA